MKKVDFNKLQAGDLVEVPRTQFAPMRSGWNGWLFSEAVVIRKGVGRKSKKNELGVEAYIRYMDDFVILSPDKEQLRNWLARIEQFLREELKLEFNPKTTILAAKNGIDFVGYKHRATHRKVRKDSIKRIKRTIKKCESGKITKEQLQKSIQSWTGHAGHADSYNLRKKIETLAEAAIEKAA